MLGFIIWIACGIFFFVIGIYSLLAKKPVGFFANAEPPEIENVKAYNRSVGILWIIYAIVFCILGTPLLVPQNSVWILFSVLGIMFESIILVIAYLRIERKYEKKQGQTK